ncbi:glycosyltransferase family 2 protein [Allochromatium warmingii]|uniref:glycosyltransferase family 2 protein n=1 Tax=Allochromatium warmingii TaxID=61595 RepID=UPI0015A59AA3|nr:glycosyltransferase family 2 protein [Allochromatium warmingii]
MDKTVALVSVIVIAYNNENISSALLSASQQIYSNVEIIVVDDGSSDQTYSLIKEFSLSDKRVKYVQNKTNLGRSASRNVGLSLSAGEYFVFLDADDFLPAPSVKEQLDIAIAYQADIVFGKTTAIDIEKNLEVSHYTDHIINKTLNNIDVKQKPNLINNNQIVGRLYRKDYVTKNDILFPDNRRNAEDLYFNYFSLMQGAVVSTAPNVNSYIYKVGNYLNTGSKNKICDARDNLLEILNHAINYGNQQILDVVLKKCLDFVSILDRPAKAYGSDERDFINFLASLRPLVSNISEADIDSLPVHRRDIARFIKNGYYYGAYDRWVNSKMYWSKWKQKTAKS